MHGPAFHLELARLRSEFDALQREHGRSRLHTRIEQRAHLDRFNKWIMDVEAFWLTYLSALAVPLPRL